MAAKCTVKVTFNFERNLADLEDFLLEDEAFLAFDTLLDNLVRTVIPNLEQFPAMGRPFLNRPLRSVEVIEGVARLTKRLSTPARHSDLREYVLSPYLMLYAQIDDTVYLLSIRHQRQLSFDLPKHWPV